MKHNNWFWGIFFILAAVFVIASQVTGFASIGFWTIAASILLVALLIQSLVKLNYFGVFLPLSLGYMLYQEPLNLYYISPWLLLLAAVLLSIGFHTAFRSRPKKVLKSQRKPHGSEATIEEIDDNNPAAKVTFGASNKYLHADNLKSGQFYCNFGALEVYFDHVTLAPEGAEIFVDCSLGAVKLFVPRSWRIVDKMNAGLGGVKDEARAGRPSDDAPTLTLTGNVSLGVVEISYI